MWYVDARGYLAMRTSGNSDQNYPLAEWPKPSCSYFTHVSRAVITYLLVFISFSFFICISFNFKNSIWYLRWRMKMIMQQKRHKDLTLFQKIEILDKLKNGTRFIVCKRTSYKWIKHKNTLWESLLNSALPTAKLLKNCVSHCPKQKSPAF